MMEARTEAARSEELVAKYPQIRILGFKYNCGESAAGACRV